MANSTLENVEGLVKWFDSRKGYGFIVGPEGQDVFVHFSVIESEQEGAFKTLTDDEPVVYSAQKTPKGWAAVKVRSLNRTPAAG